MTEQEFERWYSAHKAAYSGLETWAGKLPADAETGKSGKRAMLETWLTLFDRNRLTLDEALEATRSIQEARQQPKGYGEHGRAVLFAVLDRRRDQGDLIAPMMVDGEMAVSCRVCADSGLVVVQAYGEQLAKIKKRYGDEKVNQVIESKNWVGRGFVCSSVACDCAAGQKNSRRVKLNRHSMIYHSAIQVDPPNSPFDDESEIGIEAAWSQFRDVVAGKVVACE